MQCKAGCAQCCHVDLSIFEGEAQVILEWTESLQTEEKKQLLEKLKSPQQTSIYNKKKACIFLRNNECSIYEARPIICRTQGAVLQYKRATSKDSTEILVDVCPLNFQKPDTLPQQNEWLDLDRLNALQSIAENFYEKNKEKNYNSVKSNKDGRIELKVLFEKIILKLESKII